MFLQRRYDEGLRRYGWNSPDNVVLLLKFNRRSRCRCRCVTLISFSSVRQTGNGNSNLVLSDFIIRTDARSVQRAVKRPRSGGRDPSQVRRVNRSKEIFCISPPGRNLPRLFFLLYPESERAFSLRTMKVSSVARSTSPNISPDSRDHFSILYHHGASRKEHTVEALAAAFFSISSKLTASDTVYGDRSLGAPGQLFGSNAATFLRSFSSLSIASLTGTPSKALKSLPDALAGMTATSRVVFCPVARSFDDPRPPFYALARRLLDIDRRARATNNLDHFRVERSRAASARASRSPARRDVWDECASHARPTRPSSSLRRRTSMPRSIATKLDRRVSRWTKVGSLDRSIDLHTRLSIDGSGFNQSIDRSTRLSIDVDRCFVDASRFNRSIDLRVRRSTF